MRQKVTITLDTEIAEKLRVQSIKKYGNSRSMSRLIEDLATGAAEMEQPEACSILGHRSDASFIEEDIFKKGVEKIAAQLPEFDFMQKLDSRGYTSLPSIYFMLKEACELEINGYADMINDCWSCNGLKAPVPKYPDAGRNFEKFAMMDSNLR